MYPLFFFTTDRIFNRGPFECYLIVVATQKVGYCFPHLRKLSHRASVTWLSHCIHLVKRIQLEAEPGSSPGLALCASGSSSLAWFPLRPGIPPASSQAVHLDHPKMSWLRCLLPSSSSHCFFL